MDSGGVHSVFGNWAVLVLSMLYVVTGAIFLYVLRRRKKALRKALRAIPLDNKEAFTLFHGLVEKAAVGIYLMRSDGTLAYANPSLLEMVGLGANSKLDAPEISTLLSALRRHGTRGEPFRAREVLHRCSGSSLNVEVEGVPTADGTGGYAFVGTVVDITPHLEVESRLRTAKEEAERANLVKSVVFANMSHEIRTPLTAIIGYSDLLEQRLQGTETHPFARTIRDGGRRLLNLLNGIIDLARLDSGKYPLSPSAHPLSRPLDRVVALMSVLARQKGITLLAEVDPQMTVFSDEHAEEHIWTNLINNAIRFTHRGCVSLSAKQEDGFAVVTIKDTGEGIAEWFLPHVFEEFRQESENDNVQQDGSGLGLPITKRLIDRLGGSIQLTSTKGVGTVVEVKLPATAPSKIPVVAEAAAEVSMPRGKSFLLVEDDPECGHLVQELLGPDNQVHWFQNPKSALEFAGRNRVDIVLMDIHLRNKEYDGRALLRGLRALPAYAGTPVVAVTAYAVPGDRDRFLADGFNGYVAKPFDTREFGRALLHVLAPRDLAHVH